MQEWTPSTWGKTFTRSGTWRLTLNGDRLTLEVNGRTHQASIRGASPITVHAGVFWTDITFPVRGAPAVIVDGIPNVHASGISAAIEQVVHRQVAEEKRQAEAARRVTRRAQFDGAYAQAAAWRATVVTDVGRHNVERRWFTSEIVKQHLAARPALAVTDDTFVAMFADPDIQEHLGDRLVDARKTAALWRADLAALIAQRNEKHVLAELERCRPLFDSVESQPLTDEQSRAVICFDNRVQVVASAGSGKTSTMVAKAAYAIKRGLVDPDKILMLAFNDAAAKELSTRTALALERVGLKGITIQASTFHSFGSMVIGQATGTRKRVPRWMDDGDGVGHLSKLVDELKDKSAAFRTRWDLFRVVFGRDIARFGHETDHEDWDRLSDKTGHRTLSGAIVKSLEELTLADWLFYNGVEFEYERDYEHRTADAKYGQYRPDFYYPAIRLYHEHFALNKAGRPPPEFKEYMDGVVWKRKTHKDYGTRLVETTSAQLWSGKAFTHLAHALEQGGIRLDPNPNRQSKGRPPIEHEDLVALFRSFIAHAKSNSLSLEHLQRRLKEEPEDAFRFRHKMFLDLYAPIRLAWDNALASVDGIDYEDMLIQSTAALEAGAWNSPYELVMVDEFQDASWARARMALALVKTPGRFLFAVGDDWQSINRFAGADVSVMTGFLHWCQQGQVLRLEETFRCPQELCDASSSFVLKNPAQIKKGVRSRTPAIGPALQAFQVPDRSQLAGAINSYLRTLHQSLESGATPRGKSGRTSVYMLGRYNNDEQYIPRGWQRAYGDLIDLSFRSIHKSKGAEADYVILPSMVKRGFPTTKQDDPVLHLAMPSKDTFYQAEERRLFYVALTRARRSVVLFTVAGKASEFLVELVQEKRLDILDTTGQSTNAIACPACNKGLMVQRTSRYGPFLGCTTYPLCKYILSTN